MSDKSMMFELWTECNSRCKFCYLGAYNRSTSDEDKLYNLDLQIKSGQIDRSYGLELFLINFPN